MLKPMLLVLSLFCSALAWADQADMYPFTNQKHQQRFEQLLTQYRCVVCQNQTLAESYAPLAKDLRQQIYTQVQAGQTDEAITKYLTDRYGDFILFSPPLTGYTFLLWGAPFFFLMLALGIWYRITRTRVKPNNAHA